MHRASRSFASAQSRREIRRFAFRISDISHFGHFAFRTFRISHFATRNRTLYISRRETGHSGMTKYQIEDGARHSLRVSGAAHLLLLILDL